jgi:hypothetical protein
MAIGHEGIAEHRHVADIVASIGQRLCGGCPKEALSLIEDAREALAGSLAVSLVLLDVSSVVSVLGPDKARVQARLLRLEAEARAALGQASRAKARNALAGSLERAAAAH